jgi:aryl-alcohol dehydrogenase-like predicted oxidoreductase
VFSTHFRRALDTGNLALIRTAEAARGPDAARRHAKGDDRPQERTTMATITVKTVRLGATDLEVSPIAFGTWRLGGDGGRFDEDEGIAAIRQARELGVNFFDTAQGYDFGPSERLLGSALGDDLDHRRDEVVIATTGGLRMTEDGLVRNSSPGWLRSGVDESLTALEIDHIDVYQVLTNDG